MRAFALLLMTAVTFALTGCSERDTSTDPAVIAPPDPGSAIGPEGAGGGSPAGSDEGDHQEGEKHEGEHKEGDHKEGEKHESEHKEGVHKEGEKHEGEHKEHKDEG